MFGLLAPKVRGRIRKGTRQHLEENPEPSRLLQTMHKTLQEGETNSHRPIAAGDVGYQAGALPPDPQPLARRPHVPGVAAGRSG